MIKTIRILPLSKCLRRKAIGTTPSALYRWQQFHTSRSLAVVKPFILADIGEGIKEVQIIQWFVQPEARVEQFDKLCEVQSDKAATEITSRFDGVIKKLYYEPEDMAQVGKPLCDIDIQSEITTEDEALTTPPAQQADPSTAVGDAQKAADQHVRIQPTQPDSVTEAPSHSKHASLATPAVRGLLKELEVRIEEVTGTGRDGRVLKDDVHRYAAARDSSSSQSAPQSMAPASFSSIGASRSMQETTLPLTANQNAMFKSMTASLSIPHFLYTDEANTTRLSALRRRLNKAEGNTSRFPKLTSLSFILKAVSLALHDFPLLNARFSVPSSGSPTVTLRPQHNISLAISSPSGLVVPVLKAVQTKSILEIATEIREINELAQLGKLTREMLSGGTFTVSNIGSLGGGIVAPVIVEGQVGVLGVGRSRIVPGFSDEDGRSNEIVKKEMVNFSWSADHRIVDGATMARMGERVRKLIEEPGLMVVDLR